MQVLLENIASLSGIEWVAIGTLWLIPVGLIVTPILERKGWL